MENIEFRGEYGLHKMPKLGSSGVDQKTINRFKNLDYVDKWLCHIKCVGEFEIVTSPKLEYRIIYEPNN